MKKIVVQELDFITSICELEIDGLFFDLHNNFICNRIEFSNNTQILILHFVNYEKTQYIKIHFLSVEFTSIVLDFVKLRSQQIIDIIYRGRAEKEGNLIEVRSGKGYIYIDFVDDIHLEFWSSEIIIESSEL